jgi:hypothetical protein
MERSKAVFVAARPSRRRLGGAHEARVAPELDLLGRNLIARWICVELNETLTTDDHAFVFVAVVDRARRILRRDDPK